MSAKRFCDFCEGEITDAHRQVVRHDDQMEYSLIVARRDMGVCDNQADFHQECAVKAFTLAADGPSWPPRAVASRDPG